MVQHTSHLLCFLLLIVLYSSSSQVVFQPDHYNCAPLSYTCGTTSFTIAYPFQFDGRPDYCGYPGYYVNCTNDNATLTILISNKSYQITSIDYTNRLLNIVDTDFVNQTCPQPRVNTSIDANLYEFSDDSGRYLTLYINCSTALTSPIPTLVYIGCFTGLSGHSYYRLDNGTTVNDLVGKCSSTVLVPLGQEAAQNLVNGSSSFGQALQEGFYVRWSTARTGWCSDCESSGGYCGYDNTSLGDNTCNCADGSIFPDSCNPIDGQGFGGVTRKILIGIVGTRLASVLIGSFIFILWRHSSKKIREINLQKKKANHARSIEAFLEKYGSLAPKRYTYPDLKKMTKSFSEKLGQGGYGSVYKGKLLDGHLVAVKVLSESKGIGEDFINEVAAIGNTSHVNVVSLRGFCVEGSNRALIYDFMPNGSLEKHIYSEKLKTKTSLGWEKLYEIAIGIARGLEYLHRGSNTRVVHFDIKPHNILLDEDFCPKISDFGMAKVCPPKHSTISMYGARGTIGYIAPEVFSRAFGVVSSKSDVYSYGMMVLEMFRGKRSINTRLASASETYFPQWVYEHLDNDDDDLMAYGVTDQTVEIARKMMIVGLWCIQTMPEN